MADKNIKKITIKKSDLPPVIGNDVQLDYNLRYRVISEDQNRFSYWSPISTLSVSGTGSETGWDPNNPLTSSIPNTIIITKSSHQIELTWTMPALLITNPTEEQKIIQQQQASIPGFDVYVQWRTAGVDGEWVWLRQTTTSRFGMAYQPKVGSTGPDYARFAVQKITQIKERFNAATYLVTDWKSL